MTSCLEIFLASGKQIAVHITADNCIYEVKLALQAIIHTPTCYQQLSDHNGKMLGDSDAVVLGLPLYLVLLPAETLDFVRACLHPWDGLNSLTLHYMAEHGADLDAVLKDEDAPLSPAAAGRFGGIAGGIFYESTLENLGAAISEGTALHFAAKNGLIEACELMLASKSFTKVNSKSPLRFEFDLEAGDLKITALMVAILSNHAHIACLILHSERFLEVNDSYNIGYMNHRRSAFGMAAMKGYSDVCCALLKHPAFNGLNMVDDYGVTVLMLAASYGTKGNSDVCRLILQDERFEMVTASSSTGGGWNGNALHFAAQSGLTDVCRLLLQHPGFGAACINVMAPDTALQRALDNGHEEICRLLLTDERFTAVYTTTLESAEKRGFSEIRNLIKSHPGFGEPRLQAEFDRKEFDKKMAELVAAELAAKLDSVQDERLDTTDQGEWADEWSHPTDPANASWKMQ